MSTLTFTPTMETSTQSLPATPAQADFNIDAFERTSKDWNQETVDRLLFIKGTGSMFGGKATLLHCTIHGKHSPYETGTVTIKGVVKSGYNIARGANGPDASTAAYFKGKTDKDNLFNVKPTYEVKITGSCTGSEEAMEEILHAKKDWKIK